MIVAWASLFIRAGLIMAAAELLRRLSSRSGPGNRHRILASGFALLLFWPALSAVLPEVSIPLWPQRANGIVTVTQTIHSFGQPNRTSVYMNWPLLIWSLGVFVSLLPLIIGWIRVRRMVATASAIQDADWQTLLREECHRLRLRRVPQLLEYDGRVVPLIFGIVRPRILLSTDARSWDVSRKRMVLIHELMHVRRRDLLWQVFAHVTTALWWFQPLCWFNRRSLRQESENACDAWVLTCGIRPSDYANELLHIAQRMGTWSSRPAMAMVQPGDLEQRVRTIVDFKLPVTRGAFPTAKILVLTGLTFSVSALTIFPHQNYVQTRTTGTNRPVRFFQGGYPMKRTLISGLLASAGLTAATIGGSVFDPSGAAVSNAQALLYNPDTGQKQQAATTPDGKFIFQSLPAGSYILHIQKPGFASLYREFNVQSESDVERGLVLKSASGASLPDSNAAGQDAADAKRIRVGGEMEQENLIAKVNPVYPVAAKAAGVQGRVELEVAISKEGLPEDIRVISSPSDDLTQSALEAVRQWRYRPTLLNGQPVAILTEVIVNYTLAR
jgi:TonB family protein